jgi:hypothetical protein
LRSEEKREYSAGTEMSEHEWFEAETKALEVNFLPSTGLDEIMPA